MEFKLRVFGFGVLGLRINSSDSSASKAMLCPNLTSPAMLSVWVGVWVCGCVGVWVCGCVGVWVCVCVWVCGCVCVC